MVINCGRCVVRGTGCQDCVVTFLAPAVPAAPAETAETAAPACAAGESASALDQLEEAEVRALRVLVEAGLVPSLRLALPEPGVRTWVFPESKAS
jgi:hypothetical protein